MPCFFNSIEKVLADTRAARTNKKEADGNR